MKRLRLLFLLFVIHLLPLATPVLGHGGDHGVSNGTLHTATWRFQAWGRSVSGLACWISEVDGRWRLEVATSDDDSADTPASLLYQIGDGWTVVSVDGSKTYMQPWRDKLESIPTADADRIVALLALAQKGSGAVPVLETLGAHVGTGAGRRVVSRMPWTDDKIVAEALAVHWSNASGSHLRGVLEERGRGRGGPGEIWSLIFTGPGNSRLSSSRRSGILHLDGGRDWPAHYDPDEVFVPLWPLAELLDLVKISGPETGTPRAPRE